MTGPSAAPRGEHPGRPGTRWNTALAWSGEQLADDDTPTPRPNRTTRRAAKRANRDKEPTMTTHTHVHTHVTFANPHLVCDLCRKAVPSWHNNTACGCDEEFWNNPCEHTAGVTSLCPSWSPVDGCTCQAVFGHVDHPAAPAADGSQP